MTLPLSSSGIRWSDYRIDTPTFKLSPVEKPDMSPFLFHMTGRNEIYSILSCENVEAPENCGFLRPSIPESNANNYTAKVVCVTESPTFALDFFRYRSFRRWNNDQVYGIGFDKSYLAAIGTRPCVYAGESLKNDIIVLKNYIDENEIQDDGVRSRLTSMIESVYPLVMPLLENSPSQGFMWEREWRYHNTDNDGLFFPYHAIKIICCPAEEEADIKGILGEYKDYIHFVRSWKEYNEVTEYLKKRKDETHVPNRDIYENEEDFLSALEEQLLKHKVISNHINSYKSFINNIESKEDSVLKCLQEIEETMESLNGMIEKVRGQL